MPPKKLDDIMVGEGERRKKRRTVGDYGKIVHGSEVQPPSFESILLFRQRLFDATQHVGVHVPAVYALNPTRFQATSVRSPAPISKLPEICSYLSPYIAVGREVCVEAKPLPICFIRQYADAVPENSPTMEDQKYMLYESIRYSSLDINVIEEITRGQSTNLDWYLQRLGCVTSSKAWRVARFMGGNSRISLDKLIRSVMGYEYHTLTVVPKPRVPSLKWGLKNEKQARERYIEEQETVHKGLTVAEMGLLVHATHHFVRSSPDGIVRCTCHDGSRLLEIKCPYKARDMTPQEAVEAGLIDYVVQSDSGYVLSHTKRGYYQQVHYG